MKVFWSWQSDTPGQIGRHFVRSVIAEAIGDLVSDIQVEDAEREPKLAGLHLDHDRKGVSGSPDLVRVILEKIAKSSVFIADVTPVGDVALCEGITSKKLINSNVAIELGYALATVGEHFMLMVMNTHYGSHADLPFDLRSKAGPVCYQLAPDANKAEVLAERKLFKGKIRSALRECVVAAAEAAEISKHSSRQALTVTSADWERLAELIKVNCQHLRADSQYRSDTKLTTWRIAGAPSNTCSAYLARAGAMLLRSPRVSASLPATVRDESDDLTRWFTLLQYLGFTRGGMQGYEEHPDGTKTILLLGSIDNLAQASHQVCLTTANAEF